LSTEKNPPGTSSGGPETQPTSSVTERRNAQRYQLGPVATIRWLGADGIFHEAHGTVRDLSISGVYVESSAELRLTEIVQLEMTPPDLRLYGPEMEFAGKVVRAEKRLGRRGYAVAGRLHLC
jgi:PilZ domain-containing protein